VFDQGPGRITAVEVHFNLRTKKGRFLQAAAALTPSYYFTGAVIEKLDESHYLLEDATFTACEEEDRPPWKFKIRKALVEVEGYGRFYGSSLRVKGVPIFYLPYMLWPVKTERASGLLMPTYGYSDRRGAHLGLSYFLALGRSFDTTIHLDIFSEKYLGLGNQWRWAPEEGAYGEVTLYTIRDPLADRWQWKVNGRHRQENLGGFRLLAELEDLSDVDFFREFERSFDRNTMRYLYSYVYMTRSWGATSLNLRADRRTTFLSSGDVVMSQLPEIELRVRPRRVGRTALYWSLISSLNVFDVDRGGDLKGTYGRVDVFPSVSYTLPSPLWLTVTPRLGARATYYTSRYSEDLKSFEDDPIDRTFLQAGVDIVGPSFSRIFTPSKGPFQKLKHLVEPRLEYSFVSDVEDQELIPRFDEVDSVVVANRVRVLLANRLFARSEKDLSARELGSFELYQDYSFSDPLNHGSDGRESFYGPLGAALRLTPMPGLMVDARASYDTLFDNLRSTSLTASLFRSGQFGSLTWYQGYNPQSGERSSSQVRLAAGIGKPGKPVRFDFHVAYDVEKRDFLQQRALLHYTADCWGVAVEYRDLRLGEYPSREFRITVEFKGIGRLIEIRAGMDSFSGE